MLGQEHGFHLLSVKHLGADEHFRLALETQKRPPPVEAVGLVDKDLQFVVNESELQRKAFVCVNFISIWSTGCKNLFPDVSQWTWSARRGYCGQFDGFLRSICFSCALLVVYSEF